MELSLLTPTAALVGLLGLLPLAAFAAGERRTRAVAAALGLARTRTGPMIPLALVVAALLVSGAAAQPVVERGALARSRPSAEVMVALDTSRSMLARPDPAAPARFDRARELALRLRDALGEVPVGVASMTDRMLPHLFPSTDARAYRSTVVRALGVDRPPPSVRKVVATSLDAIASLATRNFFAARTDVRVAVVISDFESDRYAPAELTALLAKERVRLVLVRVGGPGERIYETAEDARYAPDPRAERAAQQLARAAGGVAFREGELESAVDAVRSEIAEATHVRGVAERDRVELAPWLGLLSLVPVAVVVRRRNRV
ncbi:MAG TPA: vWA domain-containing protein [Gaiellaceae bacterium]|nr:vWA domain-containing protein [Gaiellaceae bacterium]